MTDLLGLPPVAAEHGARIDHALGMVHLVMLALFVGWGIFYVLAIVRFRRRNSPQASYAGLKSKLPLVVVGLVAVIEGVELAGTSVPMYKELLDVPPDETGAVVVRVVAQQFQWNIHYPGPDGKFGRTDIALLDDATNPIGLDRADSAAADDIVTINQLHLPVNRRVLIYLTSKDVIHGFNLTEMRVKKDAIPGMMVPVTFTPTVAGHYEIACAQLCGLGHYRMKGYLTVHAPQDYENWLKENQPEPPSLSYQTF